MLQLFCPHPQARSRASIFISSAILIATISATQVKAIEAGSISIEPAQPVSGGSAILTATVEGANTLQWHFRGAPIAGATSSTLTLPTVHRGQQGLYTVVATDIGGQSSTTGVSLAIAAAQEPDSYIVDSTFVSRLERDGSGAVQAVVELADGGYLLGGDFVRYDGVDHAYLIKVDAAGNIDADWTALRLSGPVYSLARTSDNAIWVGGDFSFVNGHASGGLCRLTPELTWDENVQLGIGSVEPVRDLAVLPDGGVIASGSFYWSRDGASGSRPLAKVSPAGEVDPDFGWLSNIEGPVLALALLPNDVLLVGGGYVNDPQQGSRGFLRAIHLDGTQAFETTGYGVGSHPGPNGAVTTLRVLSDGGLLVGGWFSSISYSGEQGHLVRYRADGTHNDTFSLDDSVDVILDLRERPDGTYVVRTPNGLPVALSSAGQRLTLPTFNVTIATALDVAADGDARVWGVIAESTGHSGWARIGNESTVASGSYRLAAEAEVYDIIPALNGGTWIRGSFTHVNNTPIRGVARLSPDGSIDSTFSPEITLSLADTGGIAEDGLGRLLVHDGTQLRRLEQDGSLAPGFVSPTYLGEAVAVDREGGVLVSDRALDVKVSVVTGLKRLTDDGTLDDSFGPVEVTGEINAILPQAQGNVFIVGQYGSLNGQSANRSAKLGPDGQRDGTFTGLSLSGRNQVAARPEGGWWQWGDRHSSTIYPLDQEGNRTESFPSSYERALSVLPWPGSGYVRFNVPSVFTASGHSPFVERHRPADGDTSPFRLVGLDPSRLQVEHALLLDDSSMIVVGGRLSIDGGPAIGLVRIRPAVLAHVTSQPTTITASEGDDVHFTAEVEGDGPLHFQWFHNGSALPDQTRPILTLAGVGPDDVGDYFLRTTSPFNEITTVTVSLLPADTSPEITTAPAGGSWGVGDTLQLSVEASAAGSLTYQWRKDGVPLPGATDPTLALPEAQSGMAGIYDVVITHGLARTVAPAVWVQVGNDVQPTALVYDPTFAPRIEVVGGRIQYLVPDPSGGAFLGGQFSSINGHQRFNLARINSSDTIDPDFTVPPTGLVHPQIAQPDGKLLVLHEYPFESALSRRPVRLERLLASGTIDPSFSTPADLNDVKSVNLLPDGRLLITQSGLNSTELLLATGQRDSSFNLELVSTSGSDIAPARVVQADGRIIMWSASITSVNGTAPNPGGIFRINPDGTVDPSFQFSLRKGDSSSTTESLFSIAPLSDGRLWVRGSFWPADQPDITAPALLLLEANGARSTGDNARLPLDPFVSNALRSNGDHLWLRTRRGSTTTFAPLHPDGTWGPGTAFERYYDFSVQVVTADGSLFLAEYSDPSTFLQHPLLKLSVAGETNTVAADWTFHRSGTVTSAVQTHDGKILVSGSFDTVGGEAHPQLVRLLADGSLDHLFNPPDFTDTPVQDLLSQADGKVLIIRSVAWNSTDERVIRLLPDGSIDPSFASVDSPARPTGVLKIVSNPQGGYLAATAGGLVRLDSNGSLDDRFTPIADVSDATVAPNGTIYTIEGSLGFQGFSLNRYSSDGQLLPGSAPGANSLLLHPSGHVYRGTRSNRLVRRADNSSYVLYYPLIERRNMALDSASSFRAAPPSSHGLVNDFARATQLFAQFGGGVWVNDPGGPFALDPDGRPASGQLHDVIANGTYGQSLQAFLPISDECVLLGGSNIWVNNVNLGGLVRLTAHAWSGIQTQPQDTNLDAGDPLQLTVEADDGENLTYQWYRNGNAIAGATSASYTVASVSVGDAGHYQVIVSDGIGTSRSRLTLVNVTDSATSPLFSSYLSQASITPTAPHILVFRVEGAGSVTFLLRALGPALTDLGITDAVAHPSLQLLDHTGAEIARNRGWDANPEHASALIAATQTSGALPLAPGSTDAALLVELSAGQYFLVTSAAGSGSTVVELHQPGTTNDSARWTYVGAWHPSISRTPLSVGGFTVNSPTPRDVLVRGLGPALSPLLRVTDPNLVLRQANGSVFDHGSNDNWSDDPTLELIADQAGLIPLARGSLDSALTRPFAAETVSIQLADSLSPGRNGLVETIDPTSQFSASSPTLMSPLLSQRVREGAGVTWSPWAYGSGTLKYQWFHNDEPIADATSRGYGILEAASDHEGTYSVRVSDDLDSLTTAPVQLTVFTRPDHHDTDENQDGRIELSELLRAIELYNTRAGTSRTGRYRFAYGQGDGFQPDTSSSTTAPLARYHTADSNRDGQFDLSELLRVIELYNTRVGTTRTGGYRTAEGTTDGYAPGED